MSQPRTDRQKRRDAIQRIMQAWKAQALVSEGWTLEWDEDAALWRTSFRMAGCPERRDMTEDEFRLYHLGFTDRPRAIRHRPPQISTVPGQKATRRNRV